MAAITSDQVRELRDRSGAPMMDCKRALDESAGDMTAAAEWLRKKGIASAAKRAGRTANEGLVHAYVHHNGRVGVLLEINCESDFVGKTERFKAFCSDVAMHIASMSPRWLSREQVPAEVVEKEREILRAQVDPKKPLEIQDKILEGKLQSFFGEVCLLDQPFVKDGAKTIEQVRAEAVGVIGENIVIRRFVRFELGGE
ncbi:MAG TPA: translation elongation factor Ts [Planctomycetota bacterium]|nr:translation elongation factor Ts [Planctomycetota bacterium]